MQRGGVTADRRAVHRTPMPVAGGWRLFGMLSALYFAQGLPSGLIAKALPPLLREQGVSLSIIGLTSALALPWALKFAWAPFIDRYGSRKQWLLVLSCLTMALMLIVASRDIAVWVEQLPLFFALLFCMNLVSATQDIATDGYAVSTLKSEWRGLGNSIQVVGYKLGMVVGSGALLWLVAHHSWQTSYASLACLMLLVIVPVWFMDDPPAPAQQAATHTQWEGLRGYARVFREFVARPGVGWWLLTVGMYKFGDSLGSRMTGPLLTDSGYSLADIGVITGSAGATAGILGAFVGGATLLRLGHRQALLGFGVLQAMGLAGYLLIVAGLKDVYALAAIVYFEQFADGLSTVALFTIMMDRCRAHSPGTDYSLQASLQVLVTGIAALCGGVFAERFGYAATFTTAAVLTLLALLPAVRSFREFEAGVSPGMSRRAQDR
jgi:MFS transporter, PAT family, beta-lactamase induction signal transducer AmpG